MSQVNHQINSHRKLPRSLQKKYDKKEMEALSEEAAFVVAVKAEVLQLMPLSPEALHAGWVELYEKADPSVVLEVQSAIMNRNCNKVTDIASLCRLMNHHSSTTPLPSRAVTEMEKLESETFSLKMKQLEYDVQALRVARAKRSSWELQVHHAKLQYRIQAFQESTKAACNFMYDACKLVTHQASDDLIRQISAFISEKTNRHKLDESGNVSWIQVSMWKSCPAYSIPTITQTQQANPNRFDDVLRYFESITLYPPRKLNLWMR